MAAYLVRIAILLVLANAGCTRPLGNLNSVKIAIKTAGSNGTLSSTLPTDKKACYGIHVSGPGIPTSQASSCSPQIGIVAGFVEEGGILEVTVPQGDSRKFELFVNLVNLTESCGNFDLAFTGVQANAYSTYLAGSVDSINLQNANETIAINLAFPGIENSVANTMTNASACRPQSGLKALLYSNGDIIDATGSRISSLSHPATESFTTTPTASIPDFILISTGGVVNFLTTSSDLIPPQVYSITRKPDTGKAYGLLHSGKIVELALAGVATSYTELNSTNCPFRAADCQVPEWMQSISAGFSSDLFAIDHEGTVYQFEPTGPIPTATKVAENVQQVSFY